jgi:hypothetical protein
MRSFTFPEFSGGRHGRLACFVLAIGVASSAAAAPVFFVNTNAQSNYRTATGPSISYNTNTGATQTITNDGFQTETYSGSPNVLGLTSSFDQTTMSDSQGATGSSYASADLNTGIVRAAAAGSGTDSNGPFGVGAAHAMFEDTLTFTVQGAGSSTVTDIGVNYNLDGTDSYVGQYTETDQLVFGSALTEFYSDTAQTWASADFVSSSPNDGVFQGVYALTGSTIVLTVELSLNLECENGCTANYMNTSLIGLTLPSNVSFTSASGVFLAGSSVPEPSSWAMVLIGGLGMMAGIVRRRRSVR